MTSSLISKFKYEEVYAYWQLDMLPAPLGLRVDV
jgi:hypothetical protein